MILELKSFFIGGIFEGLNICKIVIVYNMNLKVIKIFTTPYLIN